MADIVFICADAPYRALKWMKNRGVILVRDFCLVRSSSLALQRALRERRCATNQDSEDLLAVVEAIL